MDQDNHITTQRKWKQVSERERYKIEGLLKAGHTPREIAAVLGRDRRTVEREIRRGSVIQRRLNPYVSRNPEVKDYLDEMVYAADVGQQKRRQMPQTRGGGSKLAMTMR